MKGKSVLCKFYSDFRTNAVRVLQKFMDDHIIEEVNGFKEFKDDTTSFYR